MYKKIKIKQCAQWCMLLVMVFGTTSTAWGAQQTRADLDSCRNSQIISYTPHSGSDLEQLQYIEYIVSGETQISSLESFINGSSYPVQYRALDDGTYRARIVVPETMNGSMYVAMGAESVSGTCNDLLHTSFVLDRHNQYSTHGVRTNWSVGSSITVKDAVAVDHNPVVVHNAFESDQMVITNQTYDDVAQLVLDTEPSVTSPDDPNPEHEEHASSIVSVITEGASTMGSQAALAIGGLSLFGSKSCHTIGSAWAWYVWLAVVWLWLVALWMILGYTVEPHFGTPGYASRLGWTVGIGTVLMGGFWWFANPCYSNMWVPVVLVLLGWAMYWLYSEEQSENRIVT